MTLLKSVLSALPLYCMSLLVVLKAILQSLEKEMRRLLWDSIDNQPKIHLVEWKDVCEFVSSGCLGILDLNMMNKVY